MFQVEHLHADDIYHHHQHHDDNNHHSHDHHDTGHRRTIPMMEVGPTAPQLGRRTQIGDFMKKMLDSYNIKLVPSLPSGIVVD